MKLNYVRLLVRDFDACFNFYAEILRFEVTWGRPGDVYASFGVGSDTSLSIFAQKLMLDSLRLEVDAAAGAPRQVLCFASDNIDEECNRLQQAGVCFINQPQDYPGWGCRCAHFADPEGNIIEINQELPQDRWSDDLIADIPENRG